MIDITTDPRFTGIKPFGKKIWLSSSPTMHGDEQHWVDDAIETNWVSTVGANINEIERIAVEKTGRKYAVALSTGTASLHLAIKLAGEKLYGQPKVGHGTLEGHKVFCSDMTFDATVNPVAYEGGEAVFIDTERDTWNMDPEALRKAFEIYPEVKLVVLVHLYGTPAKIDEIRAVCDEHGALIVEDAAESLGATYKGRQTGTFGDISAISFNGNKIITGSAGGMLLTDKEEEAHKARKWSTQSREDASWYQHEELGYNYRMSNIVAGVVRGQLPYLEEHIAQKKAIYERYKEGLKDLPVKMNPIDEINSESNYWLSCLIIDKDAMCKQVRGEKDALYISEKGKSCPTEILDAIAAINAEGRPIWKPMHMQPIYSANAFITAKGSGRAVSNAYIKENGIVDIGADIFERGLCLPSDNKMTAEEQERIIEVIHRCFGREYQSAVKSQTDEKRIISFSPPDISELEIKEVAEAMKSGWITTGPRTKLLERRLAAYIETGHTDIDTETDPDRWSNRVVCMNSATAAEELNLRILGVRPGDEVIVPAYTYTATASAAVHCGAKVVFVDIQKDGDKATHSPEMDYDRLEEAITERTKAIIAVDLGGIVCDYDRIFEIVDRKRHLFTPIKSDGTPLGELSSRIQSSLGRVAVISDAAHALGASRVVGGRKKYAGAIADFTSFSFHAVKNFTTAEGGASSWRPVDGVSNSEIYKMFQLLSLHGQSKDALAKTKLGAWEYDIVGPWYKCNMTDITAAIGLRQLDRYLGLVERRNAIIEKYDAVCDELGISHLIHHTDDMDSSNHLYIIRIPGKTSEQRNQIIERMAEAGVATNVHYKPLPMMTAYGSDGSDCPNSLDYYSNLITLPLHTLLTDEDVEYVCKTLKAVLGDMT